MKREREAKIHAYIIRQPKKDMAAMTGQNKGSEEKEEGITPGHRRREQSKWSGFTETPRGHNELHGRYVHQLPRPLRNQHFEQLNKVPLQLNPRSPPYVAQTRTRPLTVARAEDESPRAPDNFGDEPTTYVQNIVGLEMRDPRNNTDWEGGLQEGGQDENTIAAPEYPNLSFKRMPLMIPEGGFLL